MHLSKATYISYNLWQIGAAIHTLSVIASTEKKQRTGTFILFSLLTPLNYNLWRRAIFKEGLTYYDKIKLTHFIKALLGIWHIYAHLLTLIPIIGTRYDTYSELVQFADNTKTPIFKSTANYLLNYQIYSIQLVFVPMLMIDIFLTFQRKHHKSGMQVFMVCLSRLPDVVENAGKQYTKFALSANVVRDLLLIESALLLLYREKLKRRNVNHWQATTYKKLLQVADPRSITPLPCQIKKLTIAIEYGKLLSRSEYNTKYLGTFWSQHLADVLEQTYTITHEDKKAFKNKLYHHAFFKEQVPLVIEPSTAKKNTIFLPSVVSEEVKYYLDFKSIENLLLCQQSLLSTKQHEHLRSQYKAQTLFVFKSLFNEKKERSEHETPDALLHLQN